MNAMLIRYALPVLFVVLAAAAFAACGGDDAPSPTAVPATATATAQPPTATPVPATATATPEPSPTEAPAEPTVPAPEPTLPPPEPSPTAEAPARTQRWIEVNVTTFVVRLMDGDTVIREIAPIGVGLQIDTGEYASTQTGVFAVHNKNINLTYDAPYDTYISHWVGFDPAKDNGFHSFLKDAGGNVVDASTGRVSNGCIRTGEPEAIFDFAEIGMTVVVRA